MSFIMDAARRLTRIGRDPFRYPAPAYLTPAEEAKVDSMIADLERQSAALLIFTKRMALRQRSYEEEAGQCLAEGNWKRQRDLLDYADKALSHDAWEETKMRAEIDKIEQSMHALLANKIRRKS